MAHANTEPDPAPLAPKPWYSWKLMVPLVLVSTVMVAVGVFVSLVVCLRWKMRHFSYCKSTEPPGEYTNLSHIMITH